MQIAIPSETDQGLESIRSGHFGHCPYFTIVTIDDGAITDVRSVRNVDHDQHGCGGVIEYTLTLGIDAILTAGMGMPPFTAFSRNGVRVFIDGTTPKVGDVVQLFLAGDVAEMSADQACRH